MITTGIILHPCDSRAIDGPLLFTAVAFLIKRFELDENFIADIYKKRKNPYYDDPDQTLEDISIDDLSVKIEQIKWRGISLFIPTRQDSIIVGYISDLYKKTFGSSRDCYIHTLSIFLSDNLKIIDQYDDEYPVLKYNLCIEFSTDSYREEKDLFLNNLYGSEFSRFVLTSLREAFGSDWCWAGIYQT